MDDLKRVGLRLTAEGAADFKQTLQACGEEMRRLQAELKASQSAYDKNTTAVQKLQDRQKYLQGAMETYKDKVSILKRELEELKNAENRDEEAIKKKENQLKTAQRQLSKYENQLADCEAQLKRHNIALEEMARKLKSAGEAMENVGGKLTKGVTAPIVAAGAAATGMAMKFEDSMAKVSTIADTTEVPLDQLEQQIKDLSNQTGISAAEIAENVYSAISAGRSTGDAVAFVAESTRLAKAGFTDSAAALDVLTTILNAYGKSAEETANVSDILINTQNLGKTTVAELASSMGSAIPTASAFGVSLEQLASAYVVMTKNGISTAEATTYINGMLNELGKSGTTASDVLKEKTGKSFVELMGEGKSLSDVLALVNEQAAEDNVTMADMFGNVRAGKAALTLTNDGGVEFTKTLQTMGDVAGATDEAFQKVSGTTSTKFTKAMNRMKTSGIELGDSILDTAMPAIDSMAGAIENATETFNGLSDEEKEQIVKIGAIVAAAGPVMSITGKISKGVGSLVGGIAQLTVKLGLTASASSASAAASTADAAAKGAEAAATETATAAQMGLNAAFLASPAGQLAAVIGLLAAGAIAFTAAANQSSEETQAYNSRMKELKDSIEDVQTANDNLLGSLGSQGSSLQYTGAELGKWKEKLGEVVDAEGKVKEGCESTANYILNELNQAMGTSYSVTADGFIQNSEGAAQSLEDINKAIASNIEMMKQQAIQQAVSSQYAEAMQNAATANQVAESAASEYAAAIQRVADAEKSYNEERAKEADRKNAGMYGTSAELIEATRAWTEAKQQVSETKGALDEAAGAAAEAQATLDGLNQVMDTLAEGTPESVGAAAEVFAGIPSAASEAGTQAAQNFSNQYAAGLQAQQAAADTHARLLATGMIGAMNDQMLNSPIMAPLMKDPEYAAVIQAEIGAMQAEAQGATLPAPEMEETDYSGQVQTGVKEMGKITSGSTLEAPDMSDPDFTVQAQTGISGMDSKTKSSRLTAPGMKTPSWTGAAQQGRSAMQAYLSNHPLTIYAKVQSNVSSVTGGVQHNAQGNIIEKETLSWIAEGNKAEAVIPLEGDRARALKLYKEAGKRLGIRPEETEAGSSRTENKGSQSSELTVLINAVQRCVDLLEEGHVIQMDGETVAGRLLPRISRKMGVLARK